MKKTLFIISQLLLLSSILLSQQYQNVVLNSAAQNLTLDNWDIISNGGDGWATTETGGIDNTSSFVTSFDWDRKSQAIDLVALGYDIDLLSKSPIVLFAEKYKGTGNGSSPQDLYELHIELKDEYGQILASFSSGILTCSDEWQTIKGSFRNYGSGLRYIYYEHGGMGVNYWAGHYGAMIDDSHISILNNVYYSGGKTHSFSGWEITEDFGDGWIVDGNGWYTTSYAPSTKHQMIDLLELGYTPEELDSQPLLNTGEWVKGNGPDFNDYYWMTIKLMNESKGVLEEYNLSINTSEDWQWVGSTFENYGEGLRFIYFEHGGQDAEYWVGHYGSTMDYAFVDLVLDMATDISISKENSDLDLSVYPNPAIDHFTIKLNKGEWINAKLIIINPNGQLVYEESLGNISNQVFYKNITLNSLNKGIYFVTVISEGIKQTSRLVIK